MEATGCHMFEVKGRWNGEVWEVVTEVQNMAVGNLVRQTVMGIVKANKLGQEQVEQELAVLRTAGENIDEGHRWSRQEVWTR